MLLGESQILCCFAENFCSPPRIISNIASFRIRRRHNNGTLVEVRSHLLHYNDRVEYVCSAGYKHNLPTNYRYCHGRRGWTDTAECVGEYNKL